MHACMHVSVCMLQIIIHLCACISVFQDSNTFSIKNFTKEIDQKRTKQEKYLACRSTLFHRVQQWSYSELYIMNFFDASLCFSCTSVSFEP